MKHCWVSSDQYVDGSGLTSEVAEQPRYQSFVLLDGDQAGNQI